MKTWTLEMYKSLSKDEIQKLSSQEFHSLALKQKEFFPDLLKFCDEETILYTFYEAYKRKHADG